MNPAISRPPLITSIIAYSSAMRIGLVSGTMLPLSWISALVVRSVTEAAIRLGFGIMPNGLMWCSLQPIASKPHSSAYTLAWI